MQHPGLEIVPAAKLFASNHTETADFAASADLFYAEYSLFRSRTAFAERFRRGRSPLRVVFSAEHRVELWTSGRNRVGERRAVFEGGFARHQLLFPASFCIAAKQAK